jgi:hypothetical protein
MPQLSEAIARYHQLLERPAYQDFSWAATLQEKMRERRLTESGRLVAPVLRPHFISVRQYQNLAQTAERIAAVLSKMEALILDAPALMSRLQMLPAEKMLAAIPPGYQRLNVTSALDAYQDESSFGFNSLEPRTPAGVAYQDALADLFLELPVMKEFKRGRYKLSKPGNGKQLPGALLRVWKEFGGKTAPQAAVLEFKTPSSEDSNEGGLLADLFTDAGIPTRVVAPEQLEYKGGVLRSGDYRIDLVFRRLFAHDLLLRYDLSHPLLMAYRERAVCVVNSFRAELGRRRALFALLTDENFTGNWAASERRLIAHHVPWTRLMLSQRTLHRGHDVDLPRFVARNRQHFILGPNEVPSQQPTFYGREMSQPAWERAVNSALRTPYVVQEAVPAIKRPFPVFQYGELQIRELHVMFHPHMLLDRMQGLAATLSQSANGAVVPTSYAPVILLEGNNA